MSRFKALLKVGVEFLPLLIFFVLYRSSGLLTATLGLIISSAISIAITYALDKKLSVIAIVSSVVIGTFGGLSLYTGNGMFIKLKPTIVDLVFASILLFGYLKGQGLMKYVFGAVFEMPEKVWLKLSLRFAIFFVVMAILNEVVWRTFSEDLWVKYKVFGVLPITLLFAIMQLPYMIKYSKS